MAHPFGELLSTFRARKPGLTQARLAKAIGYDAAVLARMCSGQRDLTGPSGREKIVFIIAELHREDVLHSLAEANSLLAAASMPPLYEGVPAERILIDSLKGIGAKNQPAPITDEIGMPSHFVQHNLPAPITTFVGRESEIAELAERLITTRLLTLTGAGGSGKTRLALRIASLCAGLDVPNEQSHFDALRKKIRWVWWIDLTLAADEPDLLRPIARVLNVDEGSGQHLLESLIARLRDEEALLVLDNCEHLVQPCVAFVIAALQGCHRLIILATSRELLNIMGEAVWRVPGLQLHAESAGLTVVEQDWPDSIRLFCIRATAINQHFAPSLHDLSIIAHICERLDGMPLAIELAATQLHHLTLVDIAARLDDQFNLLAHEKRMTLPRHQTLRTTLEWSDSLLSEDERRFFHHLGVFTGVWSADAAGAITGVGLASAGMLDRLVSKSLLQKNYGEGLARYSMLEPVRQYALVKLKESGEEEAMRQAHLDYYLECAEHLSSQMSQMKLTEWLALFNAVQIQFRSALTWASKTQARASQNEKALRLAVAANQGWHILGHYNEGLSALKAPFVLCDAVRDPATARLRALAMHHMIFHLDSLTDWVGHQALQPACEACLRQCQENHDVLGEAHAHHVMSCIALSRQDVHLGRAHAEICFSMFVELGDAYGIWGSSPLLAYAYKLSGLQDERIATLQKAIDKLESLKAIWYVVDPLRNLSGAMIELGDMAQAVNLLIKTLEYSIILDDHYIRLWSIELLEVADYFLAHQWAETFLKHQRETHETNRIAAALHQLGRILLDGDGSGYERSAVLLDEAIEHWRLCGIRWARTDSLAHTLVTRGQLARFMGDSRQASLCLETAIQIARDANDRDLLAWAQLWRGYLLAESDIDRAVSQLKHCLANFLDWRYSALNVVTLALLSDLYRRRYTDVTAFTLFGACAAHAHALAIVLQHARRDFDRILMSAQNELSDPAVLAAWNKGRAMTLAQATALALQ